MIAGNQSGNAYRTDLAYIHDVGFTDFARTAAPGLLEILRQGGTTRCLVIDLGCGSGIWARELVAAGYEVLGIDISAAMIALARKRVPQGAFRQGSFLAARLPPCVAVTSIGECFSFLFDTLNAKQGLVKLFRRIHDALRPGGLLIFDVAAPGRVPGRGPQKKYFEGEDWAVLVTTEEDRHRKHLTRRITSFRKVGNSYRRDEEVHHLRLYTRSEIAGQLRGVGFRVRFLRGYGAHRFPPGWFGVLSRKP
jgi:SAM-dependent methyltransferase